MSRFMSHNFRFLVSQSEIRQQPYLPKYVLTFLPGVWKVNFKWCECVAFDIIGDKTCPIKEFLLFCLMDGQSATWRRCYQGRWVIPDRNGPWQTQPRLHVRGKASVSVTKELFFTTQPSIGHCPGDSRVTEPVLILAAGTSWSRTLRRLFPASHWRLPSVCRPFTDISYMISSVFVIVSSPVRCPLTGLKRKWMVALDWQIRPV